MSTGLLTTNEGGEVILRRIRVRVVSGPSRGEEALLDGGTMILGSHEETDLRVRETTVSRYHVELGLLADGVRLRDLGSTNGTFVADHRIESVVVHPPCEFRIGKARVELLPADLAAPDAAPEITSFGDLVGEAPAMRRAFGLLQTASLSDVSVLIEGEAGTGKSTAAVALHRASSRASGPFTAFDVLTPTGALQDAALAARGGTLVVENLDAASRTFGRELEGLLSARTRGEIDFRLIGTSRVDLRDRVAAGGFDRDLYFAAASGVRVVLPPLRERREDIPLLLRTLARRFDLAALGDAAALRALGDDPLVGNVRELAQVLQQTAARLRAGAIEVEAPTPSTAPLAEDLEALPFKEAKEKLMGAFERRYVEALLERHDGNVSRAAAEAGLDRNYLARIAKKHGLR